LEYEDFRNGAKLVLMQHKWATFPSIAELRDASVKSSLKEVNSLSAAEAWSIAWKIAANTDPEVPGSFSRASRNAPELVLKAIDVFGLNSMCYGSDPVGVIRGQFVKIYEQLATRKARTDLIPAALKDRIEGTLSVGTNTTKSIGKNGAS
jgi:hypothetical protein